MLLDPKFGPAAQTPEQRTWVLEQMQRMIPGLTKKACTYTQQLYTRYVAGELSWPEVYQARERLAAACVASIALAPQSSFPFTPESPTSALPTECGHYSKSSALTAELSCLCY